MSTVQHQIRQLKNMPLRKAVKKIAVKAVQEARFAYRQHRMRRSPIALRPGHFRGFETSSRFLGHPEDLELYRNVLISDGTAEEILRDADRICMHVFDLLGSGETDLGPALPWHEDFKTGYRWENKYYKRIVLVDLDNAADVKVPWELSRFQHFFTLGKAYWLTQDEKYALEFRAEIEDWIERNPVEMSVNWTCAMDVAIRAVNWIAAASFFRMSPVIPEAFWTDFHASLYLHGTFIRTNLENTGEHTGNHYTANLAGLVALGLYFRDFRADGGQRKGCDPAEWLAFGMHELEKEMLVQVNEDGTNYEASTSYHRLVAEMFLVTAIWCARNGLHFSDGYMERLEKMHDFILQIMKPDGRTPLVGDADDGRYVIASRYGGWVRNDFRHLLAVAGECFDRDDFRAAGQVSREDALWIAGKYSPFTLTKYDERMSAAFPEGGYYVLRSPEAYCLIRCGELSFHGHGAHSHNDQLSFELNVKGQDVMVDPGSFIYSADFRARNVFRSTSMHNTLQIGNLEQNDIEERKLFLLREQTFAVCDAFRDGYFAGRHQGYLEKIGIVHQRELTLTEDGLSIVDTLECEADAKGLAAPACAAWVLAPGVTASGQGKNWVLEAGGCWIAISFDGAAEVQLHESWVSTGYGTKTPSRLLRVHIRNHRLKTDIRWG